MKPPIADTRCAEVQPNRRLSSFPNYFLALAINNIILFIAVGFGAAVFAHIRAAVRR